MLPTQLESLVAILESIHKEGGDSLLCTFIQNDIEKEYCNSVECSKCPFNTPLALEQFTKKLTKQIPNIKFLED